MRRAFWIFTTFVALFFMSISLALAYFGHRYSHEELVSGVNRQLSMMAVIASGSVAHADYERIEEEIHLWGDSDPNIIEFKAITADGHLLAEFTREVEAFNILHLQHSFYSPRGREILLTIAYDLTQHDRDILRFSVLFLLISGIITTGFILSLWMIINRFAIRPLHNEIAVRRKAEDKLAEASRIIDRSPAVALLWRNTEGWPVEYASQNVYELFGHPVEYFTSKDFAYATVIHPDDLLRVKAEVEQYSSDHECNAFSHEPYRIIARDGRIRWIEDRTYIRRTPEGMVTHFEGIVFDISQRKEVTEALRQQLRFEALLAEMSAVFVNLPVEEFDSQIRKWLQPLAELGEADHCSMYIWDDTSGDHVPCYSWTAASTDFTPCKHTGKERQWSEEQLSRGTPVAYRTLDDLPKEADIDRPSLAAEHFGRSVLTVPVMKQASHLGELCISTPERMHNWPSGLAQRLRMAADVFANAILRKRSEETLTKALSEIRDLKEQVEAENIYLREEIRTTRVHGEIVGQSEAMKTVLAQAEQVAQTDSTVLIQGETGTGKELLARAIHNLGPKSTAPLIVVNCAAIPSTLVESELFGHEKGAFTGAMKRQTGRFEAANGGTIFLDEVGELPFDVQAKLLRVLQFGEFERLGSHSKISVKVRVIAATNRDLKEEVKNARFREDLFYRLNVFPIALPPLRERAEDIPELTWTFIEEFNRKMGKRIQRVTQSSFESLKKYSWPGNIRELRNVIERAMIRSAGSTLAVDLPKESPADIIAQTLEESERSLILLTLKQTGWRIRGKNGTAEILKIKPTTLESRIKKLGIKRPQ